MNWEAVGAIGETVGSVAVFVTLGYLAVQVRQARHEVERSISQSRAETVRGLLMARATHERLGELYVRASTSLAGASPLPAFIEAVMGRTGLTTQEAAALYWDQLAWWQYRVQVIPYVDELAAVSRAEFELGVRRNYGMQPLEALFYQTTKATLPADAVRYVDDLLASGGSRAE